MTDAQSEIAMEMESHNLTPQQARQMALDHLHLAEAGREACRAKEAHECTCGTLDAYTHCQAFVQDIQAVLDKHGATLTVTDDHRPWGMHSGIVEIDIPGGVHFQLPTYMEAVEAAERKEG